MSDSISYRSSGGGCLGALAASVISYALNHSVGWAILHFFFSWFYLAYVVFFRTKEIVPALSKFFGV